MSEYYDLFKALHIVSVISWMVGMLYLPRLFVYHVDAAPGSDTSETFKVMERRLMKAIINPAMIASFIFGLLMLWIGFDLGIFTMADGWLHSKLLAVVLLAGARGAEQAPPGVRGGPEHPFDTLFPHPERGSDRADDHHRLHGDPETVLTHW